MPELPPPNLTIGPSPRLALDVAGRGPLVLFMHGIGGNRTNWQAQKAAFSGRYTFAAWDARGYGSSEDWDGPLIYADLGHDVVRVLDHFGVRQAHIVGLSMGGRIAMQFAKLHPDRVGTLTLVDTHLSFTSLPPEKRKEFVDSRRAPLLAGKELSDIAPVVARSLIGPHATPEMLQQLIDSISVLHKHSYIKFLEATVEQDSIGDLDFIKAPTHFVVGEDDKLTPPELTRRMAAQVPGSHVTVLEKAGHLSNIENPAAFDAAVLDFIDRHPIA